MTDGRVERRLAAILAADVAGYSRLIGQDEVGTLARLRAHRHELIDPKVAEHKGRIVKTTGDGILVEFPSVVEAVDCAIAVQRGMIERNARAPERQRIEFRVGINMGEIVVEDGDIFGDGVNVAARLEALAEPGGILVSARVQEDVAGKLDLEFEDLGERSLKKRGKKKWTKDVFDTVQRLSAAMEPDEVVLGGGGVDELHALPDGCRRGENENAFLGGFRLWDPDWVAHLAET